MQIGIIIATISMVGLATLTPDKPFLYEALVMVPLGLGLGVLMPTMNLVVQSEFKQHELGVATSSSQLFRSLGSTIGTAVFGAMLTAGIVASLGDTSKDAYLASLRQSPEASKVGSLDDVNTLLTLNTPDVKKQITEGAEKQFAQIQPAQAQDTVRTKFLDDQKTFSSTITHAFSDSLQKIFIASSLLLLVVTVLVFLIKEKPLAKASPITTPGAE